MCAYDLRLWGLMSLYLGLTYMKYIYTWKKLSITFFCDESLQKIPFLSPDHSEMFRACIRKVCLDAAKINEVQNIPFLSYGGYKMP